MARAAAASSAMSVQLVNARAFAFMMLFLFGGRAPALGKGGRRVLVPGRWDKHGVRALRGRPAW